MIELKGVRSLVFSVLLCSLSGPCVAVGGGPPFITDDPEPVDFRHWEVYFASSYLHFPGQTMFTAPHVEVNYGAAPNLQLHVIGPMQYVKSEGQPAEYGYGTTELGVKYRFVQETATTPMVGVFPLAELSTGDASRGLSSGQNAFFLPVWIQKSFKDWTTYGGGGYWINPGPGNRNYWFFGWQAQKQVTKQCAIGAEVFHTTPSSIGDTSHDAFNLGLMYDFDDGHHFLFSAGRDLHGNNTGMMYFAYQWTFGPHEKKVGEGGK